MYLAICLVLFLQFHIFSCNLVRNPSFETSDLSGVWIGQGSKLEVTTEDATKGSQALKISTRSTADQGVSQEVPLRPRGRYVFIAHVKQLNDVTKSLIQTYTASIEYSETATNPLAQEVIARYPSIQASSEWFTLQGVFMTTSLTFNKAVVKISGPSPGIEFLVDDVAIEELAENKNWENEANANIEKTRMTDIHFIFKPEPQFEPQHLEVKVWLKRHKFGFGSVVEPHWITDLSYKDYQDIFYYMFNSATIAPPALTPKTDDTATYDLIQNASRFLNDHEILLRSQLLPLDNFQDLPSWLTSMTGPNVEDFLQHRLAVLTNATQGLVSQWDVVQASLEDSLIRYTKDIDYTKNMVHTLGRLDPNTGIFLSGLDIASGTDIYAYADLAKKLKSAGVSGIGIQSMFTSPPDPTLLKVRLDVLASTGLPLWVTDLRVTNRDGHIRSDWLDSVLKLYFSHPGVYGVTLEGFWNHDLRKPYSELFKGFGYESTEAGSRFLELLKDKWTTVDNHKLANGTTYTVRLYQGDYELSVYYKEKPILYYTDVHFGKVEEVFQIHVRGNGSTVVVPEIKNPFTNATHDHHTSHIDETFLAAASTKDISAGLTCVSRWSNMSASSDLATTDVSCLTDEVMTSCSSYKEDWVRNGERVLMSRTASIICRAVNGLNSNHGVYAIARCCKGSKLTCQFMGSGVSDKIPDAEIEANCPSGTSPTGCMAYQNAMELQGSHRREDGCIAVNGGFSDGIKSSAACCRVSNMICKQVESNPSGPFRGNKTEVSCPSGYPFMTGCSGFSSDGKIAGAYIEEQKAGAPDQCVAANGEDRSSTEETASARAVCCAIPDPAPMIG